MILVAMSAIITFIGLIIVPVAPALVTILATPFIAMGTGWSPAALILTLGFCAANCYLLPFDTVPLLTYGTGYYKVIDMPKSTIFIQIWLIMVLALWIPFASRLFGII
jgi:sodium-dependent dicarboxylate transporter 2/3/5